MPGTPNRTVLLVGGGHSHALAIRFLASRPLPGARVLLVSDSRWAPYSGMLPGHLAGAYAWHEFHIDLPALCRQAGIEFLEGAVRHLDPAHRRIEIEGHGSQTADLISINVGATPDPASCPGAAGRVIPSKPIPGLLAGWSRVLASTTIPRPHGSPPPRLAFVGAGAGGVELALALHHRVGPGQRASVLLLHAGTSILPGHNPRVRTLLGRLLAQRGIEVRTGFEVAKVGPDAVQGTDGTRIPVDAVFWMTHAVPPEWIRTCGIPLTPSGHIRVHPTLQVVDHPAILAAGDVATIDGAPRPKSGVFAVRMARPLVDNLRALLEGRPPVPFHPQRHILNLIGTADGRAVASRRWLAGHSRLFAWWKDHIDRAFMRQFPRPDPTTRP